jgi:hypothetical protein
MAFRLVHARYDRETERAYVELRDADDDGGEIVATAILSYRMVANLSKPGDQSRHRQERSPCAKKGCGSHLGIA